MFALAARGLSGLVAHVESDSADPAAELSPGSCSVSCCIVFKLVVDFLLL